MNETNVNDHFITVNRINRIINVHNLWQNFVQCSIFNTATCKHCRIQKCSKQQNLTQITIYGNKCKKRRLKKVIGDVVARLKPQKFAVLSDL